MVKMEKKRTILAFKKSVPYIYMFSGVDEWASAGSYNMAASTAT